MNVATVGDFASSVNAYGSLNMKSRTVMPFAVFCVKHAVKTLVILVDDFNCRRRVQVAFEDVNSVPFKVGFGKRAQFGKQSRDAFRIFHRYHSLRFERGADTIKHAKSPVLFVSWSKQV